MQDAIVIALRTWRRDGVPANPGAWLSLAARRRAIDLLRKRSARFPWPMGGMPIPRLRRGPRAVQATNDCRCYSAAAIAASASRPAWL